MNFIAQAFKGKIKWYHYFITAILVFIIIQIGILPLLLTAFIKTGSAYNFQEAAATTFMNIGINTNLYLALMLIPFVFGLAGLFLCLKTIHNLNIKYIITARKHVDWQRIFYAFGLWFVIAVFFLIIDYFVYPTHYEFNFKPIPFALLVLVSVLLIPLQTSFEEIFFRGYLMQAFGVLTKKRIVALVITSVVFGLLHGSNPEVAQLGKIILVYYVATGFLFGIITLMDEGIELSIGLHAANNIAAALFVTTNWTVFQTDALFFDNSEPQLNWMMFIPLFVVYPILLWWFSKKYDWKNWKQKLLGSVERPTKIIQDLN